MSRVQREEIERLRPFLLTLETGMIAGVPDEELQQRVIAFPATSAPAPNDDVDLVLLAGATACLQEGSESAAAYFARDELVRHPERTDLTERADITLSDKLLRPRIERYLQSLGYGPNPFSGSIRAVADVYLGRVDRGITHPIVGVACVAYFGVAQSDSRPAPLAVHCQSLWSEWLHRQRPVDDIERDAKNLATDWLRTGATR